MKRNFSAVVSNQVLASMSLENFEQEMIYMLKSKGYTAKGGETFTYSPDSKSQTTTVNVAYDDGLLNTQIYPTSIYSSGNSTTSTILNTAAYTQQVIDFGPKSIDIPDSVYDDIPADLEWLAAELTEDTDLSKDQVRELSRRMVEACIDALKEGCRKQGYELKAVEPLQKTQPEIKPNYANTVSVSSYSYSVPSYLAEHVSANITDHAMFAQETKKHIQRLAKNQKKTA